MTTYLFDTITPAQAMALQPADLVLFSGGSGRDAVAKYDPPGQAGATITITFGGHAATFDFGVVDVAANGGLRFDDGSRLLIGGPREEELVGTAGNDALFGGGGADTLLGHSGDNVVQGNQGDDRVLTDEGADVVFGGQGNDILVTGIGGAAVERGDFAQGNLGDDTIVAGNGGDTLLGGQGNDSIQGLGGADMISGDRGDDTLSGGSGADTFRGFNQGGDDRIVDFKAQEGDLILLDHGSTFDVVQSGANTLILIDHGSATITLVGVDMSTLQGAWIGVA